MSAYHERSSMRHVERTCSVSRPTLVSWLKKNETNLKLEDTLLSAKPEEVLESGKMWSFVQEKWNKRWIWTIRCRRTRQIAAFVIGDRCETAYSHFWEQIPPAYKGSRSTAISGKLVNSFFLSKHMNALVKGVGRPIAWSAGIVEAILRAVHQKNIIFFRIRCHARNRHSAFHHPLQPIT